MTSTVVTPGDLVPPRSRVTAGAAVITERPSFFRRIGNMFSNAWNWLLSKGRNARHKTVSVVRKSGSLVARGFKAVWMGAEATAAWMVGLLGYGWQYTRRGSQAISGAARTAGRHSWDFLKWTGRGFKRGYGYIGYGLSVVYAWAAQSFQGAFVVATLGIIAALVLGMRIVDWFAEGYEHDAKWYRWMSMGPEKRAAIRRGEIEVPALYRRKKKVPVGEGDTMRERFVTRLGSVLLGQKVELTEIYDWRTDPDMEGQPPAEDNRVHGVTDPWFSKDDPRMNEYEGMTLYDVLERHKKRLDVVTDRRQEEERSFWSGRIYFLEKMIEDEANLTRLEPLYNEWRAVQPRKRADGLARGAFRRGMIAERKVFRTLAEKYATAPAGSK